MGEKAVSEASNPPKTDHSPAQNGPPPVEPGAAKVTQVRTAVLMGTLCVSLFKAMPGHSGRKLPLTYHLEAGRLPFCARHHHCLYSPSHDLRLLSVAFRVHLGRLRLSPTRRRGSSNLGKVQRHLGAQVDSADSYCRLLPWKHLMRRRCKYLDADCGESHPRNRCWGNAIPGEHSRR